MQEFKNPETVHRPFSNYTHCVEVQDPKKFLFCSGQVPADERGNLLPADNFVAQAEQVFTNIGAVLANSGAEMRHVVRLVTYLTRQEDVAALRDVLKSTFGNNAPANSVVLVSGLTEPSILLEVEATAVI
ncbi:RidA family protein [Halomonas halmophila]|uniref:Enamine deaminase RidA n=1 Tax=Halomonas halmophila TaxID=252 RepID=A0A4Y4F4H7_9GAMM|nr:RidA family protein [Halomonas halmophila]GED21978.1 hypothetical protein HHA01_09550 [Halomonas halmophila]